MIYSNMLHNPWLKFNLGNQLFVIASLLGMAHRYQTQLAFFKEWKNGRYFDLSDIPILTLPVNILFREPDFSYSIAFFDKFKANSTFSWWGAYLSEAEEKQVVRPYHHFDGPLKNVSIADHYPTEWLVYNHLD